MDQFAENLTDNVKIVIRHFVHTIYTFFDAYASEEVVLKAFVKPYWLKNVLLYVQEKMFWEHLNLFLKVPSVCFKLLAQQMKSKFR